jgi:hypothetical protein
MEAIIKRVKYVVMALFVVANISGASATFASTTGVDPNPTVMISPRLTDAGSSYWTVRVDGSGFSRDSDVYIQAKDLATDAVWLIDIVHTTPGLCLFGSCWGGGSFSYTGHPVAEHTQCVPGREIRALDLGLDKWANPIVVGCR